MEPPVDTINRLMIEYTGTPFTRQQLKAPIIGCRYSMIISFCYYNGITDVNTIKYIISHPLLDNLINGFFNSNDGKLMELSNPIQNIISNLGIYPFVLVMNGYTPDGCSLHFINHYFNILNKGDGKFYILNSFGSDYITSPYQKKQIIPKDIDILNMFNTKNLGVIDFFTKYFIPDGLTTFEPDSKKFYNKNNGIQAEINHFTNCNIAGIFYLDKLRQQINNILNPQRFGGSPYKSNKKKKTNKKRKSNKKKKTNKRKKSMRK